MDEKALRLRLLKTKHFRVTIFGSARIKKNNPVYKNVQELAKLIGQKGMDVVTGGGPGLMEAANTGHKKGNKSGEAHSIGLGINLPNEQKSNKAVEHYIEYKRFSNRLDNFMLFSSAVVVADGGVGTLLELFYTWQLMQVNHTCHIPLILYGDMWGRLLKWLKDMPLERGYFKEEDLKLLYHAKTPQQAMEIIEEAYRMFEQGGENFCINYNKYKLV